MLLSEPEELTTCMHFLVLTLHSTYAKEGLKTRLHQWGLATI